MSELDPEVAQRLGPLWDLPPRTLAGPDPVSAEVLAEFGRPYGPPEGHPVDVHDTSLDGPHGTVPVRVYRPVGSGGSDAGRPGLVWMHGGAFLMGDLDMPESDQVARGIVARVPSVVVCVDYRLSVDGVHFPVPHDDVVAAFRWVAQHAAELGIDRHRLAIGGGSAGGNLAAGAALRLRDTGGPLPWQVLLAYPVVHAVVPEPSPELAAALERLPAVLRFDPVMRDHMNSNYVGGDLASVSPYAFPAAAEDLRGYPPTLVETSELDDLRPSGEAFGAALAAAGVPVETVCRRGAPHGHLNMTGYAAQRSSLDLFAARLEHGPPA